MVRKKSRFLLLDESHFILLTFIPLSKTKAVRDELKKLFFEKKVVKKKKRERKRGTLRVPHGGDVGGGGAFPERKPTLAVTFAFMNLIDTNEGSKVTGVNWSEKLFGSESPQNPVVGLIWANYDNT